MTSNYQQLKKTPVFSQSGRALRFGVFTISKAVLFLSKKFRTRMSKYEIHFKNLYNNLKQDPDCYIYNLAKLCVLQIKIKF